VTTARLWFEGARPKTLGVAVAPVLVGTAAGAIGASIRWERAGAALVVALALQVGVNYANDYSDGIRGTDHTRVGPVRLVGQRLATAANVKLAAMLCFGAAAVIGLALVALSEAWWMLLVGAASIVAAWYYTGGKRPYGYSGFGELFVFVFFGLVATLGTMYTQALRLDLAGWAGAVGIGALASALLVANNLRDIPGDAASGKRTLAVRLGDRATRVLYAALLAVAAVAVVVAAFAHVTALLALAAFWLARPPLKAVTGGARGRDLVPVLAGTGRLELVYAVLLTAGFALSRAFA
jgi:1,4-dihydroxy-2-naphthoate octaprenyltransferase